MKRAVVILVGISAIFVWAMWLFSSDDEPPVPAPPPSAAIEPTLPEPIATPDAALRVEPQRPASPAPPQDPPVNAPAPNSDVAAEQRSHADDPPSRMGPVDELKAAYESDVRDAEAPETEQRIRAHFDQVDVPPELVRSISCVKTVCKLELRLSAGLKEAYMVAMMNLVSHVSQEIAMEPVGPDENQVVLPIDVYVSRVVPPYMPGTP